MITVEYAGTQYFLKKSSSTSFQGVRIDGITSALDIVSLKIERMKDGVPVATVGLVMTIP